MNGLSRKIYLKLPLPTEDDPRSDQQRILDSLAAAGVEERVHIPVHILRKLYPLLDNAKWKITVSLAWNGENWEMVEIEEGDTTAQHYGSAVDLGSTTVVARLLDCNSGEILKEVSCFNKQIQWGTDILSRIFYCKDNKEKLEEVRRATVESICECMDKLDASHSALSMVIAGNTTMIHFLLGMDAFCVFYTPHAVHADRPGFQLARDLDISPIGTMAHEYMQSYQSQGVRLRDFQKAALEDWVQEYRGDLGIALTDTVGMDAFLADFDLYFAKLFDGLRHDSGDPIQWAEKAIAHYHKLGIEPMSKTLVFSDSLTLPKALEIFRALRGRINVSFGIGTNLTCDIPGVEPMSIVLKMTACNGQPVAKISDEAGKTHCTDPNFVAYLRHVFKVPALSSKE